MIDVTDWAFPLRIGFLQSLWARVGVLAAGRPIAIFGGGRHTHELLKIVLSERRGPEVLFILDDNPNAPKEICGVPVRGPIEVEVSRVALVLASSDSIEETLLERAKKWARGVAPVMGIYTRENEAEIRASIQRYSGIWGVNRIERSGHFPIDPDAEILRLPAAAERTVNSALPIPPAELCAGYHAGSDAAYLESGKRDIDAIKDMIRRNAPDVSPIRRVLDWGCSSGRMLRHWQDLAVSGGEAWGCDICSTTLEWSTTNLSPPFRFFQSTTRPSLPLPDASMDLVYGNSVFTHIRELVDTWLMELRRIVRPGGLVFTTILDENWWDRCGKHPESLLAKRCPRLDFSQPMSDDFVCYGGAVDPVTFWHSRGVRRRWSFAFDVVAIETGTVPYQTGVLLRRPG